MGYRVVYRADCKKALVFIWTKKARTIEALVEVCDAICQFLCFFVYGWDEKSMTNLD